MRFTAYEILGVEQTATAAEIKAAWKRLAVRWHPDKCAIKDHLAQIAWRFAENAHATIADSKAREEYDRRLANQAPEPVVTPSTIPVPPMSVSDPISETIAKGLGSIVTDVVRKVVKKKR